MVRRVVAPNNLLLDQVVETVNEGKEAVIPTKGRSMFPFIVGGKDTITLTAAREINVGDIVLAKIGGTQYVVHRIIKISGQNITLMGDGNIAGREHCTLSDIMARAIAINHNGKVIDCNSGCQQFKAKTWRLLLPLRRIILGIWRRLPCWPFKA